MCMMCNLFEERAQRYSGSYRYYKVNHVGLITEA